MGFENPQNNSPMEGDIETGNEEREKLMKELEDVNKSIEWIEKSLPEFGEKYDHYHKLLTVPNEEGVISSWGYIENKKLEQVYSDLKEEWSQKLEDYKLMKQDLEKKLNEMNK